MLTPPHIALHEVPRRKPGHPIRWRDPSTHMLADILGNPNYTPDYYYPGGVAVDGNGNVYVADTGNNRIQKFTNAGTFLTKWSDATIFPFGIAVDASGDVFVIDIQEICPLGCVYHTIIQKFTNTGTLLATWGGLGSGDVQFDGAAGLAVDRSGDVFIVGGSVVVKFTNTGTFVAQWGSPGIADGQFNFPTGVAVDGSGHVFVAEGGGNPSVADPGNNRIQKFACP